MEVDNDTDADEREFVVTATVTLAGATVIVRAFDEEEAIAKAKALDIEDGFDTAGAELVNWQITGASLSE